MKSFNTLLFIITILSGSIAKSQSLSLRDTLSFKFDNHRLSGYIDMPIGQDPHAIVVIIPGHGKTYFRDSLWYFDTLITRFSQQGFASFRWDRAGCGNSEGNYNHDQTVQSSALEALAAISELSRRSLPGSEKIGLWGISRGGYICPLIIKDYPQIEFWISVSGTDGLNSWDYMFESDLVFSGKSSHEAKALVTEYLNGWTILEGGGSLQEYLHAQQTLHKDSFCISYLGLELNNLNDSTYTSLQNSMHSDRSQASYGRDPETKSMIVVPYFGDILEQITCPVLAIFGEKDFVVDWKKTKKLYQKTMGKNPSQLKIRSFADGNHMILKCRTGAATEELDTLEFSKGYLQSMLTWLMSLYL